jgi:hypothetical protein
MTRCHRATLTQCLKRLTGLLPKGPVTLGYGNQVHFGRCRFLAIDVPRAILKSVIGPL